MHQFKESDGTKLNPTKEGLDPGGQDEKMAFEELVKETLGDKVEEVLVNDRWVDSVRAHTTSEHGLPVDTERIMRVQAPRHSFRHTASKCGWSAWTQHSTQQRDSSQAAASTNCKQQTREQGRRKEKEREKEDNKRERRRKKGKLRKEEVNRSKGT